MQSRGVGCRAADPSPRPAPVRRGTGRTGRGGPWLGHVVLLLAAFLMTACRPSAQSLADTLPREVDGEPTRITAVQDELSGLVIDDALEALDKGRQDASIAFATADPDVLVLAITVSGIGGTELLDALETTWPAGGPMESATIGDKNVTTSEEPSGARVYFYLDDAVVYVVETAEEAIASSALSALP